MHDDFLQGLQLVDYIILLTNRQSWELGEFHCVVYDLLDILTSLINLKDHKAIEYLAELAKRETWYMPYFKDKVSVTYLNVLFNFFWIIYYRLVMLF